MNIIQFGPYPLKASCIKGGVESSVYGLSQTLVQHHEVSVFDIPRIEGKDTVDIQNGVYIHRYKNCGTHNQDAVQRVDEILRDIVALHPDIVHVHGTGEISAIIYKALKEYGFKVIMTIHGLLHVEKKNQLRKKLSLKHLYQYFHQSRIEFEAIEKADVAIVDTEYVAIQLRKLFEEKKIKCLPTMHIIPQGINANYLSIDAKCDAQTILSVGSISERKGHLFLIRAFEQLSSHTPDIKLIIAGSLADKKYYQTLLDYVEKSSCKEKIEIKPNLSQEQIYQLYQTATLFALHSQEESQGIVFVEAMAVGLPVVATEVGGVPYVVKDQATGLLSNYSNVQSFAENIKMLLENKSLRDKMAKAAKQEAKKYNWKNIAEQIENLYIELKH